MLSKCNIKILIMENIIFEICLRTNYETTIKLLQLYPRILNKYNNIWKLKCNNQFPNKPYFDLWTGAENYLICTKIWCNFT